MLLQLRFFLADYKRMCGKKKSRYLYLWLSRQIAGIAIYRFERGMLLTFGKHWKIVRVPFLPLLNLVYFFSNCEINYNAEIGPGLCILHSPLGITVSGSSVIGKNLTLTGGNLIGIKGGTTSKIIKIGDNVQVGANAVIIGPIGIGNDVTIGASACVVKNAPDGSILAGVPAKIIRSPIVKMFPNHLNEAEAIHSL